MLCLLAASAALPPQVIRDVVTFPNRDSRRERSTVGRILVGKKAGRRLEVHPIRLQGIRQKYKLLGPPVPLWHSYLSACWSVYTCAGGSMTYSPGRREHEDGIALLHRQTAVTGGVMADGSKICTS